MHWTEVGDISNGALFLPVPGAQRHRRLSSDVMVQAFKRRLKLADLPEGYRRHMVHARALLTRAALDGAPIQAAMRLSLRRSMFQAQK
ncbi:hypothetical protein [Ruegeria sp. ANG-R]|uniref:hypothetical protein n=1 Tax=Ruegeria sp. ANG-R TaxID=1577903 RepID=UPI00068D4BEC|nr:hypothetical protein [Ruegeria sp. ANG-R]